MPDAAINMADPVNWGHPLNQGLLGWWMPLPGISSGSRLDDLTNMGSSGRPGTLTNMDNADWVGPISPGGWGALGFNGSDNFVNVGTGLAAPGVVSVFALISPANIDQGEQEIFAGSGGGGSDQDYALEMNRTAGRVSVVWTGGEFIMISDASLTVGATHLVGFTRAGVAGDWTVRLYIDGVEDSNTTTAVNPNGADAPVSIGRLGDSDLFYFEGRLASAWLYDRVLSAPDVLSQYHLSLRGYPGLLNRLCRPLFVAAAVGAGIRNPFGGPMVLRNPLGA